MGLSAGEVTGPLSVAIYGLLNVAAFTALSSIVDDVPESPTGTFTWYAVRPDPIRTFGKDLADCEIRLRIFSPYAGMKQAQAVLAQAIALLHEPATPPTITGWTYIAGFYTGTCIQLPEELVGGVKFKRLDALFRYQLEKAT